VGAQAIFCACMALTFGHEIVVFSPARRASRKLLERVRTETKQRIAGTAP